MSQPITITPPACSTRDFDGPTTPLAVAEGIGSRLAKAAVGARINGELADVTTPIVANCELAILTEKTRDGVPDEGALFLLRHSTAHVMAEAIQRVVPEAMLVYGPPLENGFYYDIAFPEDRPLREGDFEAIEAEMAKIVKEDRPFTRYDMEYSEGLKKLEGEGSKYKLDNAHRAHEAGSLQLSFYATGEPGKNWEDLCRGPHVPSTGRIGAFKVMSLASSYWHGDENSDRLTRVYGTSFFSKKELDEYLHRLEEARKRDHRVLGKQLDLFHIDDAVGQGLVLWTPRGSIVRKELQDFISAELTKQGYSEVFTPHIGKLDLYKTSGLFPYYQDSQCPPIISRDHMASLVGDDKSCEDLSSLMKVGNVDGFMLSPMNCPHHVKIYAAKPRSYRELPYRIAEFGTVYRWEQSGELNGMTRVRGFTQDDAHLFCTPEQVDEEVKGCLELVKIIFGALDMHDYRVRVGLRDPDSGKYTGDPENWDKAEEACRQAAQSLGVPFTEEPGEAAFYGPKIDFVVRDVIGREWQLGTVQVDYSLPERFDLTYIGADNQPHRPIMIHRAPFGSLERFVGLLIEHFAGAFPLWLSPEQVRVLPISEKSSEYAHAVLAALRAEGIRATVDDSDGRIQAKIKHAAEMRIPYMAVVGPRAADAGNVSVRARGIQKDLGGLPIREFVAALVDERDSKGERAVRDRFAEPAAV
ncbi:MAG: threonine--tRNA ligase [Phycisphaerales bacterium]